MPPEDQGNPLSDEDIETLRKWIAEGAISPEDEEPQVDPATYWSYLPIERPPLPDIEVADWGRTPIDAFLTAGHEDQGLNPAPEASPSRWLRRVYLDLVGLPPTVDELHAFLAAESENAATAYERVVDDLLGRPQYGERWGRHWMDVWRYSDWYGRRASNEIRYSQRHIWRWRDWIVESLNDDKGYDDMVREMLAGDELAPTDADVLRATGFLGRNWYKFDRNVWMFDTVEQTAQAFLGLTMRCARCHDHKYDPISQKDYYRFRAFFEPHDVRTDPVDAAQETEQDPTFGAVLTNGLSRVYDGNLEAATHVFRRGDGRHPVKDEPLSPAVPAPLGGELGSIDIVPLPVEAFYPALQPGLIASAVEQAGAKVSEIEQELSAARDALQAAQDSVSVFHDKIADSGPNQSPAAAAFLEDDFSAARDDIWEVVSGDWAWEDGHLLEKQVASFATIVTREQHPRDFRAVVKYRTLAPGGYRSVGFSFDHVDQGNSQDVYTSTNDSSPSVQAFHRIGGGQVYPPEGIVRTPLSIGEMTTLAVEVRGPLLTIDLNGERKLEYVLPVERRDGKFALWVHNGSAEFHEVSITPTSISLAELELAELQAAHAVELEVLRRSVAEAGVEALQARIAAEQARYGAVGQSDEAGELAKVAGRAERVVAALDAEEVVLRAEHHLQVVQASVDAGTTVEEAGPESAVGQAEQGLAEARASLESARAAVESGEASYAPLGEKFPATSSGRRTALADWIASSENPRTARVAVNHIWLRHFGEALVPTVENFGLNGSAPSHPELLDWLAAELIASDWRMKPIHRMIVLSSAYRLDSSNADSDANSLIDPDNQYLWRMNSRRMEAEVVRDSVLSVTGTLDLTRGGPELPDTEGQTTYRRSLYFCTTPNQRMELLDLFDVADPNQCYRRRESVVPQQALAMMNSGLVLDRTRVLAEQLSGSCESDGGYITVAFETILNRIPTATEQEACVTFLEEQAVLLAGRTQTPFAPGGASQRAAAATPEQRARENLLQVLFSHNDFVTIR